MKNTKTSLPYLCFLGLLIPLNGLAQKSVWKSLEEQKSAVSKTKTKKINALKKWGKHLQEWGLDSSFRKEFSLGATLHTNGFGGQFRYIINKEKTNYDVWLLNITTIKHDKEIRQQRKDNTYRDLGTYRPYVLGKVNEVYSLQIGYGKEQMLLPDIVDGNVPVTGTFVLGAAMILSKPVYLQLLYPDNNGNRYLKSETYSSQNEELFLSNSTIVGPDKWSKGLGEMKIIPGLFAESNFTILPSLHKTFVQRIHIGANLAYYLQPVDIMALHKGKNLQYSFYVGIGFGKRVR